MNHVLKVVDIPFDRRIDDNGNRLIPITPSPLVGEFTGIFGA